MVEFDGRCYSPQRWAEMVRDAREMVEEGWPSERRWRILRHDERLRQAGDPRRVDPRNNGVGGGSRIA
ncbi:MAG TPA: hypothetical protein VM491_05790 [Burkholderiaceae bacterium]|nr:hypothetical protein [Burkholderiaceae bacterium]